MSEPIHVLSLGAGVQSSTLALMAAEGLITPMPAFAVFADTGDESKDVYRWLERLREILPFRVKIAHRNAIRGKLSDNLLEWDHSQIPAFKIGEDGKPGIGKRQCTKHWKIVPVHRKIREVTNTQRKQLPPGYTTLWQGISIDEVARAKPSRVAWITHRFPLFEERMRRQDCEAWLAARGLHAPKSACVYCPYRSNDQWRASKIERAEWELITRVDAQLNARGEFLHPSCKPINEVDLSTDEERGQGTLFDASNQFLNECEGMCGV